MAEPANQPGDRFRCHLTRRSQILQLRLLHFFSEDEHLRRSRNGELDARRRDFKDLNLDVFADQDGFALLAPDYEHGPCSGASSCSKGWLQA